MVRKMVAGVCFDLGRHFLHLGSSGAGHALRLFRWAYRLWPAHPEVGPWLAYLEGSRALMAGRPDEALELLRQAGRALPDLPAIRVRQGIANTMLGRDEEAITLLERALSEEITPLLPDLWTSLSWSYLRSGRPAQSLEACRRAEQSGVQSPRLELIYRLAAGVQVGTLPVEELRDLLRTVPQGVPLLLEYARMNAGEGRHRLATAALSALPAELQDRSLVILGLASLNAADLPTALWAAEQLAPAEDPEIRMQGVIIRSEVAVREGDSAGALALLDEVGPGTQEAGAWYEQRTRVLLLSDAWDEAVGEAVEALHHGDAGALSASVAALGALELGDPASARRAFVVDRPGDLLAHVCAQVAQARLLSAEGNDSAALQVAEWAAEGLSHLPAWAARPRLMLRLTETLRVPLRALRDAGEEPARSLANAVLKRLDRLVPPAPHSAGVLSDPAS